MSPVTFAALPSEFPQRIASPRFAWGDRVQWRPRPTADHGIIIGIQYAPAPHLQAWSWKYTLWLDADSPSHAWTPCDTAWEADLEAFSEDESTAASDEMTLP